MPGYTYPQTYVTNIAHGSRIYHTYTPSHGFYIARHLEKSLKVSSYHIGTEQKI